MADASPELSPEQEEMNEVAEESEEDEILASSEKHRLESATIQETIDEDMAYKMVSGQLKKRDSLLEQCMHALSLMYKLDPDTCLTAGFGATDLMSNPISQ